MDFPKGPVLTITTTVSTFLTSGLALYSAWVLSRVWCILDVLIFKSMCDRTKMSLAESQCAALLVNSNSPFGTLLTARQLAQRGGPKGTLTKIILASLVVISINAATPLITTAFPSQNVGLFAARSCGYPRTTAPFTLLQKRFVDTAFLLSIMVGRSWPEVGRRQTIQSCRDSPIRAPASVLMGQHVIQIVRTHFRATAPRTQHQPAVFNPNF